MKGKLSVKGWLKGVMTESEHPFFSIADNIDSIANASLNPAKRVMTLPFRTKDGRDMKLKVKDSLFYDWTKGREKSEGEPIREFLLWVLGASRPAEGKMVSEIVDEYNNLIGDDDLPKDIDNRMIGLSSTDSDVATYQTRVKPLKNYNSWGLGFITW